MKYTLWLNNGVTCFALFTICLLSSTHGRRYDKCETSDGRQGVCVVKRYCREATSHPLLACDHDNNFCCPIPTTHRSSKPLEIPLPEPQNPPNTHFNVNVPINNDKHKRTDQRPEHFPNKPTGGSSFDVPLRSNRTQPNFENGRKPEVSNSRPVREHSVDDYGNKSLFPETGSRRDDGQSRDQIPKADIPGRVRFEGSSHQSTTQRPKYPQSGSRREHSPDQNQAQNPSESRRDTSFPNKHNENTFKGTVDTNRNRHSSTPSSTVSYKPFRDELEIQKLPSNPRRLRPLPHDGAIDTNHTASRDHILNPGVPSNPIPQVPGCGVKPYDLFIAGGETSKAHEWPWMTAIFRRFQGSRPKLFICGGSLINNKYVLTAAHCFIHNFVKLPTSSFVVRLGSHYLDSGEEYTIEDLIIHQNHSGADFFNDIALVRIASQVYITDKIAPICLPSPDMISYDFVNRRATVAGWGDTAYRSGSSRALQHVTMPIVSTDDCSAAYSRVTGAAFLAKGSDHIMCAGLKEGGKDACSGDSGGPLMLKTVDDRWMVVGIVCLGYKCAEPGYPGVYTRVTHYLSWIQDNMKNF